MPSFFSPGRLFHSSFSLSASARIQVNSGWLLSSIKFSIKSLCFSHLVVLHLLPRLFLCHYPVSHQKTGSLKTLGPSPPESSTSYSTEWSFINIWSFKTKPSWACLTETGWLPGYLAVYSTPSSLVGLCHTNPPITDFQTFALPRPK